MPFEKYTAPIPTPKPKPHVKIVRTIIQFTEDGLAHLGEIAEKLKETSQVHLWVDRDTNTVAITPAAPDDPDAFAVKNGKIQAKKFFDFAKISVPVKDHSKTLEAHEEGVKLTIGSVSLSATHRNRTAASSEATPDPKPGKKKAPWKPGDPIPPRGRKSAAQLAWLAEQKVETEGAIEEKERGEG